MHIAMSLKVVSTEAYLSPDHEFCLPLLEGNHADYLGWTINGEAGTRRGVDGGVVRKKIDAQAGLNWWEGDFRFTRRFVKHFALTCGPKSGGL